MITMAEMLTAKTVVQMNKLFWTVRDKLQIMIII